MRCYFLKGGHIAAVEQLEQASDQECIAYCQKLFDLNGKPRGADAYEIWDGPRFICRYPEDKTVAQT